MKNRLQVLLLVLCMGIFPVHLLAYEYEGDDITLSLDGYLEASAIYIVNSDSPDEDPSSELGLDLNADLGSWASFKGFFQFRDNGTVLDPHNGLLFNEFDKIYQDKNPSLDVDEAYLDIYTNYLDLRLGIQKYAWGRLDEINPTDNLNTEDFTRGGTNEEDERKIGAPSIRANVYSDIVNLEIAWIPQYVPYRLPDPEERWFPAVSRRGWTPRRTPPWHPRSRRGPARW